MRNTSKPYSKQNSQEPKQFRGGEKKVMKKSLSLVVAAAMTLTTASVAFADTAAPTATDLTSQQKFDALKALGIFSGYPDGTAGLDKEMTRAEFAKVLTKLSQLEENAAAASVYKDVPATHWAVGFVGAVTEAQLMNGLGANKFGPSGQVTIEQIAKVADLVAGVEPVADGEVSGAVSGWAKGYVAAAIKAGLLPELPSYQTNATRDLLVSVTYDLAANELVSVASTKVVDATHIEVTFSDGGVVKKELTTALVANTATKVTVEYNGKSYEVSVTLTAVQATSAAQSGAKKITVKFNQAVSAADQAALTYELKSGLTTFPVTATFAADGQSADLAAAYLPAGDFTLTVKGSDAISLKVEAEAAKKLDITATAVQPAAGQDLGVKVYNQFGEEMTASAQVTSYNITKGKALKDGGTLDLSNAADAAVNDSIIVTAIYPAAGLSANKTLKVTNGSSATSIKLDQVQPLTGDARVSVGKTGYVLPLTMVDGEGHAVKLPATTAVFEAGNTGNSQSYGGLVFYISDRNIISNLKVDSNGVVTFDTNAVGQKAGTAYVTVTNGATAASASTSVVVNDNAKVKTFQLGNSGSLIVKGEKVVLPFTAVDSYGAAIAAKDVSLSNVTFNAFGKEYSVAKGNLNLNAKGELEFTFGDTGTTTVYVYVDGVLQASSPSIDVKDVAYFTAVNGIKDVATTYEVNASNEFDQDNILLVDNYGRVKNVDKGEFKVVSDNKSVVDYVDIDGKGTMGLKAGTTTGSAKITITSTGNADNTVVDNRSKAITEYSFTVNVVASSDIKSYAIDSIGTVYGEAKQADASVHAQAVSLLGKTSSGASVALVSSKPDFVTSSDEAILKVSAADSVNVVGQKAGKATVAAYLNGSKVAEQEVTVSEDAPVVKSVEFGADEYTVDAGKTVTVTVTVKDQYGKVIAAPFQILSDDTAVAKAPANSLVVSGLKHGSATLTYTASNGTQDTAIISVN
ncbi:S-layer homology domain-containing protein [Paenibacillus lycopersici]|uniref:S-layer homology domain-containing protein n=1 Tax=Paenibacillus lycopersici TaxID=2704462 RepID=A0A6C0G6A2_9BACL|nr:S-layer homology domain-containing protein [Paenibacillus lycopersici]QHT63464.1 S-layer homology domain-containing protein [Paenibacillus lycopersici]